MAEHIPVLLAEVLQQLAPLPNENVIDCNIGSGGHAQALLQRIGPHGILLGIDLDLEAIEHVDNSFKKIPKLRGRYRLVSDNFTNIDSIVNSMQNFPVSRILFDLGLSSMQLDESDRGFSFKREGILDMRFNSKQARTSAWDMVNTYDEQSLARIFREYGEERFAKQIARKIIEKRKQHTIDTPSMLVEVVSEVYRRGPLKFALLAREKSCATKVFQALRIAVNDELENLVKALPKALDILVKGGRMGVISFHSLEDRIVKQFFRQEASNCLCPKDIYVCQCGHKAKIKIITKKPLSPTQREISVNSRARSAKLRVAEKL